MKSVKATLIFLLSLCGLYAEESNCLNTICNKIETKSGEFSNYTGITPFFDYYAVLLSNPSGGNRQATNYTHEMLFGLELDMQKIASIKGMTITVSGAYNAGANLSEAVGNYFTLSESSVSDGAMFYEFFVSQEIEVFDGDSVTFSLGRMSMSDIFCGLPVFGYMVSGAINSTPEAIFFNSPFTSSPQATWGIAVEYDTVNNLSFAAGLYQIQQNITSKKWDGLDWKIRKDDGYMAVFQAQWSPAFYAENGAALRGQYQLGGWFYGGYNVGGIASSTRENAYGLYLQGQQTVWQSLDNKSISLWAGLQYAPLESVSAVTYMAYAGVRFKGFTPNRPNDALFFSWTGGWFSENYKTASGEMASCENIVELTYVIQLNQNISIQPDLQYVITPNGDKNIDNALVVGGQLVVSF